MKSPYLRSIMAFACATALSACGGSGGNLILSGTVVGLAKDGLVLSNGSSTTAVANGSSTFAFNDLIGNNTDYNVVIQTQPTGSVCSIFGGAGQSSNYNVTTVAVSCKTNQYNLGGTVTGIDGPGLVLIIGPSNQATPIANGAFTFQNKIDDGAPYSVTVLGSSVPTGKTCSVLNSQGKMGSADVNNLQVTCS